MPDLKDKKPPIKIGIVDDHLLMRETYSNIFRRELLNGRSRYKVTVDASNGKELIQKLDKTDIPDVIVLDINMPEMDGFATMLWLKKNHPTIKVVVVTMHSDISYAIQMLLYGASGYVTKNSGSEDILSAIECACNGGLYFDQETYRQLLGTLMKNQPKSDDSVVLTDREKEVLRLIATEITYQEIADKMLVSLRTIEGYREKLFEKLGVKSRAGLVIYAIKYGIIEL